MFKKKSKNLGNTMLWIVLPLNKMRSALKKWLAL